MSLKELVKDKNTDKDTIHSYIEIYEGLFKERKCDNLLEIGIYKGGSIEMWHQYFPNALIHAVDILNITRYLDKFPRVKKYITNAYDKEFIQTLPEFDIIIDDGDHSLKSMLFVAEHYSKKLTKNGVLIIEDIPDLEWTKQIKNVIPDDLKEFSYVVDRRDVKNRYDDIMLVIDKSNGQN